MQADRFAIAMNWPARPVRDPMAPADQRACADQLPSLEIDLRLMKSSNSSCSTPCTSPSRVCCLDIVSVRRLNETVSRVRPDRRQVGVAQQFFGRLAIPGVPPPDAGPYPQFALAHQKRRSLEDVAILADSVGSAWASVPQITIANSSPLSLKTGSRPDQHSTGRRFGEGVRPAGVA